MEGGKSQKERKTRNIDRQWRCIVLYVDLSRILFYIHDYLNDTIFLVFNDLASKVDSAIFGSLRSFQHVGQTRQHFQASTFPAHT